MKTNTKDQTPDQQFLELTEEEWVEILERTGQPVPFRSNEEWIHLFRLRLRRQKREFASLLDHAAENPDLLENCGDCRREIQKTRERLAGCRALRSQLN